MEEVLRKLYQAHHSTVQRTRIDRVLQRQQQISVSRKKYDFRQRIRQRTPQTAFSYDDDVRFEKQLIKAKQNYSPLILESHTRTLKFPSPKKSEDSYKKGDPRSKFRKAVFAVLFVQRLRKMVHVSLARRKKKAQKYSQHFVQSADKLIRSYYSKLLKQELASYLSLLQSCLTVPPAADLFEKQALQLLYYMASKLSTSTLTKDTLYFFIYTATEKGFPPSDFMSAAEINRLDFMAEVGCLVNVTEEQVRMIVGMGVGIKIFCYYLLYQPWRIEGAANIIKEKYKDIKETISKIGSVFYYILLEQFCLNLPEVNTVSKALTNNMPVKPIKALDPFRQGGSFSTSKGLIQGQSRQFLNSATLHYPKMVKTIKENLIKWISRISYAVVKQSRQKNIQRDSQCGKSMNSTNISSQGSTLGANGPSYERGRFRSIQLSRKRDEMAARSKQKSRYHCELPILKQRTIDI